jgi:type I restriction enzyme, R subunit
MTPEQRARQQIDLLLSQCGWIVQDRCQRNLAAGPGVAIREALLKGGEADSPFRWQRDYGDRRGQI